MRIVLLTHRFPPEVCGVGDYTYRLAQAIAAQGHEPVVITNPVAGSRPDDTQVVDVSFRNRRDLPALYRAILSLSPDLVQLEYSPYGWDRRGAAFWVNSLVRKLRRERIPVNIGLHEMWIEFGQFPHLIPVGLLQRMHVALLAASCSTIFLNMPERIQRLSRWFPWSTTKIRYRPNSSTIPLAPVSAERRRAIRTATDAKEDAIVIATFGAFATYKNYEAVISAVAQLRTELPVRLWLLGSHEAADQRYVAKLRALVDRLGIQDEVFWSGTQTAGEVSAHLQAADVFVLPQMDGHLTRSSAFMAAAGHGLPCIVVANAANQTEFEDGENIVIVTESNVEEFASAIRTLARDASLRANLGHALQDLYRRRFEWSKQVAGVLEASSPKPVGNVVRCETE